jgi:hypothetical protein
MSLIGTAIGALAPLLPPALLHPKGDRKPYVSDDPLIAFNVRLETEVSRLKRENDRLTRSTARLVDHIEALERELLIEQHISTHWKAEAERQARQSREAREAREARQHAQAQGLQAWNGGAPGAQAQMNAAMAQQQQLADYANQAQGLQQNAYGGFCNCVPSRAQVWGEQAQADAAAERLARLRP